MQARNRTWLLGSDPVERCRQRTMAIEGGDGSTLSLDFTTGVLDSRLTFSRASTATFVNSSGYVEYAGANTAAYSESLSIGLGYSDNAIKSPRSTTTSPTGNTAVVLYPTEVLDYHRLQFGSPIAMVGATTISVYVKQIGSDYRVGINATTYIGASVICSLVGAGSVVGAVGGTAPNRAATITKVTDDGWYRITLTGTYNTISSVYVFMASSTSTDPTGLNFLGVANQGVAIWGLQINPGSTAQTYYPTTTAAYHAPRFDNALLTSRTNLILQSNDFSTSPWVQKYGTAATLTSNYTVAGVPDGFSGTATRLQSSIAASGITQPLSLSAVSGKALKFSLYIKSNTTADQFVSLEYETGGGTVVTATPVWQRVSFTSLISITKFGLEGLVAGLDISICGAQVEYVNTGDPATAYIPTTTSTVSVNTTEPRGLLIEGQTANITLYSEKLNQSVVNVPWYYANLNTPTAATGIADPYGNTTGTTAWKLVATGTNYHAARQTWTFTAAAYTFSFYAKAEEYDRVTIGDLTSGQGGCSFVLTGNGTATVRTGGTGSPRNPQITPYPNGWYRCSYTMTMTATAVGFGIVGYPAATTPDNYGASYTADGTSGVYVTMVQVELGSGASSYIPTGGSTVTRNVDACSLTGTNFTNVFGDGSLGTITCSHEFPRANIGVAHQPSPFALGSYTAANARGYSYGSYTLGVTSNYGWVYTSAAFTSTFTSAALAAKNKCAISYNGLAITAALNGTTNSTTGTGTITVSSAVGLQIGYNTTPRDFINACVSNIKFYPTALTAAQLQAITAP